MNSQFTDFCHSIATLAEENSKLDFTPVRIDEGFITFDEYALHYIHDFDDSLHTISLYLLRGEETIQTNNQRPILIFKCLSEAWTCSQLPLNKNLSSKELAELCVHQLFDFACSES
jgi:hypothetical protein